MCVFFFCVFLNLKGQFPVEEGNSCSVGSTQPGTSSETAALDSRDDGCSQSSSLPPSSQPVCQADGSAWVKTVTKKWGNMSWVSLFLAFLGIRILRFKIRGFVPVRKFKGGFHRTLRLFLLTVDLNNGPQTWGFWISMDSSTHGFVPAREFKGVFRRTH